MCVNRAVASQISIEGLGLKRLEQQTKSCRRRQSSTRSCVTVWNQVASPVGRPDPSGPFHEGTAALLNAFLPRASFLFPLGTTFSLW